ncbi:hypothetical protein PPERSA_02505 [Pseudocohnilembus persalinus]|uniref:Uncharacterized protein n=1 Tax=Pseudocohnilembus persalinus TaxID=266149 RepID=A0A0V0QB47_PSEPJ|nr:hypothetical protein PPERSA_02505 [Pseudocohnilembus persalinus]|eukprot:KRW99393.1 hypothetical protein PPERSA_02505 [Pseudocohnilembus persalinus]
MIDTQNKDPLKKYEYQNLNEDNLKKRIFCYAQNQTNEGYFKKKLEQNRNVIPKNINYPLYQREYYQQINREINYDFLKNFNTKKSQKNEDFSQNLKLNYLNQVKNAQGNDSDLLVQIDNKQQQQNKNKNEKINENQCNGSEENNSKINYISKSYPRNSDMITQKNTPFNQKDKYKIFNKIQQGDMLLNRMCSNKEYFCQQNKKNTQTDKIKHDQFLDQQDENFQELKQNSNSEILENQEVSQFSQNYNEQQQGIDEDQNQQQEQQTFLRYDSKINLDLQQNEAYQEQYDSQEEKQLIQQYIDEKMHYKKNEILNKIMKFFKEKERKLNFYMKEVEIIINDTLLPEKICWDLMEEIVNQIRIQQEQVIEILRNLEDFVKIVQKSEIFFEIAQMIIKAKKLLSQYRVLGMVEKLSEELIQLFQEDDSYKSA